MALRVKIRFKFGLGWSGSFGHTTSWSWFPSGLQKSKSSQVNADPHPITLNQNPNPAAYAASSLARCVRPYRVIPTRPRQAAQPPRASSLGALYGRLPWIIRELKIDGHLATIIGDEQELTSDRKVNMLKSQGEIKQRRF